MVESEKTGKGWWKVKRYEIKETRDSTQVVERQESVHRWKIYKRQGVDGRESMMNG
jgi:hypothetical protein